MQCAPTNTAHGGIRLESQTGRASVQASLARLGLTPFVAWRESDRTACHVQLAPAHASAWAPGGDTLALQHRLAQQFGLDDWALERQIWVALLASPVTVVMPSAAELHAAVAIRQAIVQAARRTTLAFKTETAERPNDCWTYAESTGFVLRPDVALATALQKATQPEVSGKLYSFSCYRATEYVILLALAQELPQYNPTLAKQLQRQWEQRAIMSAEFHDVFLHEYGSQDTPVPPRYYVPGDRLWFRNPDEASANATGYEGSWVFYLGDGLFSDFWRRGRSYTMDSKCLEIYHWRHATYSDAQGQLQIDEDRVEAAIATSLQNPAEVARILAAMQRYREPRGQYTDAGGCIDTTREAPRWVCAPTNNMVLPP